MPGGRRTTSQIAVLLNGVLNKLIHLVSRIQPKHHPFSAMVGRAGLFAVKPLRFLGRYFKRNDEQAGFVLGIRLIETGVKAAVVCTGCEEFGLSQGMRFREEIVFDHVTDLRIDLVWDELELAIKGAYFNTMSLFGGVGSACGAFVDVRLVRGIWDLSVSSAETGRRRVPAFIFNRLDDGQYAGDGGRCG